MLNRSAHSAAIFWILIGFIVSPTYAKDDAAILKQIREAIPQVAAMKGQYIGQTDTGDRLADLTKSVDSVAVDKQTFDELESLLNSSDDLVRYWGAVAIGNLGSRAKPAVPKLLKMLPEADCLNGSITSAAAIRYALKHIGVKPPPPPACPNRISA